MLRGLTAPAVSSEHRKACPDTEDLGGADAAKLSELTSAAEQANVTIEIVAPVVGGVETTDGQRVPADQKIDGGPSVLYDAVVVLASKQAASILSALPAARDFATDAFADLGRISAADFIARCAELRFWPRQAGGRGDRRRPRGPHARRLAAGHAGTRARRSYRDRGHEAGRPGAGSRPAVS